MKILCPKCGMETIGGPGFWSAPKPYCSFCGWNLDLAREIERKSLKQLPWSFLFMASFFAVFRYVFKMEFPFFFILFAYVFLGAGAIVSWRRLKLLETSHPEEAFTNVLPSVKAAKEETKQNHINPYQYLRILSKPRQVRFKTAPRIITILFPVSCVFVVYCGYLIVRYQIAVDGVRANLESLALFLIFTFIWLTLCITIVRRARKDRNLLAQGDLAIAIITHQGLTGGRHPRSKIEYKFTDASGQLVIGEATDDARTLYEDMEIPVFYNPANPKDNVALATASCELAELLQATEKLN